MKANGNLAILRLLAAPGAGFDIVSGGELYRVLKAGGDPAKVVFSGVGKTAEEIDAALAAGIFAFNCESEPELALVDALAHRRGIKARVALRVNPDVAADTHAHIATGSLAHKFGIDIGEAEAVYERARQHENLLLEGVSCHIGSQQFDFEPMMQAADRVLELIARLRAKGFDIRHVDLGGGLGVAYKPDEPAPPIGEFTAALREKVAGLDLHLFLEPGRSIVGNAGVLLARVLYRKKNGDKEFVVVDAAMNDLIRPALYDAHHEILPLRAQQPRVAAARRCSGTGLRVRRLSCPGSPDARGVSRRSSGRLHRRGLRLRASLQLQCSSPPRRGADRKRLLARDPQARDLDDLIRGEE